MNKFQIGEIVKMKKKHPCGSYDWEVIRAGADIKLKCLGCNRIVMLDRVKLKRQIKE